METWAGTVLDRGKKSLMEMLFIPEVSLYCIEIFFFILPYFHPEKCVWKLIFECQRNMMLKQQGNGSRWTAGVASVRGLPMPDAAISSSLCWIHHWPQLIASVRLVMLHDNIFFKGQETLNRQRNEKTRCKITLQTSRSEKEEKEDQISMLQSMEGGSCTRAVGVIGRNSIHCSEVHKIIELQNISGWKESIRIIEPRSLPLRGTQTL